MLIYIFIAIFIAIGIVIFDCNDFKKNGSTRYFIYFYFLICCFLLWFVLAFRGDIAVDMKSYRSDFYTIGKMDWKTLKSSGLRLGEYNGTEIGFAIIVKLLYIISDSEIFFFAAMAFMTLVPIFIIIKRLSGMPFLSLLVVYVIGIFFPAFNIIRSCLAYGLMALLIQDIIDGKIKKFNFKLIPIILIHISSVIMIPLYFLVRSNFLDKRKIIISFILTICIVIFAEPIFLVADKLLFDSFYGTIYNGMSLDGRNIVSALPEIITIIIIIMLKKHIDMCDMKKKVIVNGAYICCILSLLSLKIGIFSRYSSMLNIFIALCYPILFSVIPIKITFNGKNKTRNLMAIISLIFLIMWLLISLSDSPYVPYIYAIKSV